MLIGKRFGSKLYKGHTDIFALLLVEISHLEQISHERRIFRNDLGMTYRFM